MTKNIWNYPVFLPVWVLTKPVQQFYVKKISKIIEQKHMLVMKYGIEKASFYQLDPDLDIEPGPDPGGKLNPDLKHWVQ